MKKEVKIRVMKKRPQEVRDKISKGVKAYWENVTLVDEQGNIIPKKKK